MFVQKPLKNIKDRKDTNIRYWRRELFDDNGVFPGHVNLFSNKIFLYYTGFQLGKKVRHYNFGGLAISNRNGSSCTKG